MQSLTDTTPHVPQLKKEAISVAQTVLICHECIGALLVVCTDRIPRLRTSVSYSRHVCSPCGSFSTLFPAPLFRHRANAGSPTLLRRIQHRIAMHALRRSQARPTHQGTPGKHHTPLQPAHRLQQSCLTCYNRHSAVQQLHLHSHTPPEACVPIAM